MARKAKTPPPAEENKPQDGEDPKAGTKVKTPEGHTKTFHENGIFSIDY
jgi:hypothetical protein